ncbi:unnamed protein product [Prunus armeniaca]
MRSESSHIYESSSAQNAQVGSSLLGKDKRVIQQGDAEFLSNKKKSAISIPVLSAWYQSGDFGIANSSFTPPPPLWGRVECPDGSAPIDADFGPESDPESRPSFDDLDPDPDYDDNDDPDPDSDNDLDPHFDDDFDSDPDLEFVFDSDPDFDFDSDLGSDPDSNSY